MRGIFLMLMVRLSANAAAPSPPPRPSPPPPRWEHPLLWRIEGPRPSYLFGTIHMPDARAAHPPASVMRALDSVDAVWVEVRIDIMTAFKLGLAVGRRDGKTLEDILPAELAARTKKAAEKIGLPWWMERMKKVWIVAQDLEADQLAHEGAILDMAIPRYAEEHGKATGSLETIEEQLTLFDSLSPAEQQHMLEETLDDLDHKVDAFRGLREAYFAGDEAQLTRIIAASWKAKDPLGAKMKRLMLDERNPRMVKSIRAHLADGRGHLFAVGAAHMLGDEGLVAALRRAGLTVTRVR
jgi:uncharacterized protein YbaP (TraB family)